MGENGDALAKLKQRHEVLNARIGQMEAARKAKEKKAELRRRILVGEFFLEQARRDGNEAGLFQKLDGFVTRNSDRKLFGLPEVKKAVKESL